MSAVGHGGWTNESVLIEMQKSCGLWLNLRLKSEAIGDLAKVS